MREASPGGGGRRGRGGRGMGRGGGGRVELEEGWRNRNLQRSRSGDRQLAGNSSGTGIKVEPYENSSKGKSGEKREENTGKSEIENNSKEEPEALAEDFSDFGDSDDDILNQEEDSKDEGKDSKTSSRSGSPRGGIGRRKRGDQGVLEVLAEKGEEAEEVKGEQEAVVESNARLADALGADWSVLLKPREERREEGAARKRWSGAEIFQRIGLSKVSFIVMGAMTVFFSILRVKNQLEFNTLLFRNC